jgi:hypothetical protein
MTEPRAVPDLAGVFVREAPADLELMTLFSEVVSEQPDPAKAARFRQRLVELCAVDADGQRLIADGAIAERSMLWVERVAAAAVAHAGNSVDETAIASAAGN